MSLKQKLKDDLKLAMREKNIVKRDSIRAINTMIKQIEVDERKELSDTDVLKLIQKGIKQREESQEDSHATGKRGVLPKKYFTFNKESLPNVHVRKYFESPKARKYDTSEIDIFEGF